MSSQRNDTSDYLPAHPTSHHYINYQTNLTYAFDRRPAYPRPFTPNENELLRISGELKVCLLREPFSAKRHLALDMVEQLLGVMLTTAYPDVHAPPTKPSTPAKEEP